MIRKQDIKLARKIVKKFFPRNKACIFGSSLREEKFYDVDIALFGKVDTDTFLLLREAFLESDFPRPVDIVSFDTADVTFRTYVLEQEEKKWL